MLVLLTITAVGFLTRVRLERSTAGAFDSLQCAGFLADSAVNLAIARLANLVRSYPYHAIAYAEVDGQTAPVFCGSREFNPASDKDFIRAFLTSTTALSGDDTEMRGLNDDSSLPLNFRAGPTDENGWMGSPLEGYREARAPWISIMADPGRPVQPDPSAPDYNPVLGRFSFWIEDESCKLDRMLAGNADGVNGSFQRGFGDSLEDLDLGAVPFAGGEPLGLDAAGGALNKTILDFRATMPAADPGFLNQISGLDLDERNRFYTTAFSVSWNCAGTGRRRVNLNALFVDSTSGPEIRSQLDTFIETVEAAMPEFGLRFFPAPIPDDDQKRIYLTKIAANVRDYIDSDSQPTVVNEDGSIVIGQRPILAIGAVGGGVQGPNQIHAIGKENVPFAQEYVFGVKLYRMDPARGSRSSGASAQFELDKHHYVEFWNMTNEDILVSDLEPNPFFRIANQFAWDTAGGDDIPSGPASDIDIPLSAFRKVGSGERLTRFPAGRVVVLTTDSRPLPQLIVDQAETYCAPESVFNAGRVRWTGRTFRRGSGGDFRLNPVLGRAGGTSQSDYATELVLGNDLGYLESHCALPFPVNISVNNENGDRLSVDGTAGNPDYFYRGGSLRGNSSSAVPSQQGDPRTNTEQLHVLIHRGDRHPDLTRWFHSGLNNNSVPGKSTLGRANSNYVDTRRWEDYSESTGTPGAAHAPATIANEPLRSIGELGNIFDHCREMNRRRGSDIIYSRGGGRTLKIGQPDTTIPTAPGGKTRFSAAWNRAAWRLTDLFGAGDVSGPTVEEGIVPGRINLNGVLRDKGRALRAALRSYRYLPVPESDSRLSDEPLTDDNIDDFVESVADYIRNNGPILERGELSEISFLVFDEERDDGVIVQKNGETEGPNEGKVAGEKLALLADRAREELVRRIIELTTTRSAAFTVYAVGQAIRQGVDGRLNVVATQKRAVTVQLQPVFADQRPGTVLSQVTVRRVYETQ